MNDKNSTPDIYIRHSGRLDQVGICLGKLFRMFVYQNDWKVLPMAAIIAGLVCFAAGRYLFVTMEGTLTGSFALSCVCIWNGLFNSVQVVCRERQILKREHRAGLHISSYVTSHMIYQAVLCILQSLITVGMCNLLRMPFPKAGIITPWFMLDFGITLFLITYSADMLALLVSSFVHSTTAAMTVMPFVLIIQLVFSGAFFQLEGFAKKITSFTISKWGLSCICAQGGYNDLPMVSVWNSLVKIQALTIDGYQPLSPVLLKIQSEGLVNDLELECGKYNAVAEYATTPENIFTCWLYLALFSLVFALISVICLEFIDRDHR